MHSPIQRAISEVKWKIPLEILQAAFMPKNIYGRATAMNMDSMIRSKVIEPRVMVDCDLVAGVQMDIPLHNVPTERVELPSGSPYTWGLIYRIPKTMTQNRSITSVLWIANTIAPISGTYTYASYNGSALANAAMGVMQSQAPIPSMSTARCDLIAENTVLVMDTSTWPVDAAMRCKVSWDPDLMTLPPGAIPFFSKAVELAVKAYVYNTLIIQINSAELQNGQELGKFKELVDQYADANEQYEEYRGTVLREVMLMSDVVSARDFWRLPIGAGV